MTNLIDVHAHFLPESYRQAAIDAGHSEPDGFSHLPEWSATEHIAMMNRMGVATSMLSISSPGVHFGDSAAAASLAREVNEEGRRAVVDHPGRFGQFAALPAPDIENSLEEIDHCFEHLHVDGVSLLTNVDGVYLGDVQYQPIFEDLNRRHARVFIHPTSPACWEHTSLSRPRPMIEFMFDTTRAVINLVLNGTIARHPNIAFIIPHAGATLPMITDRVAAFALALDDVDDHTDVKRDLARLHYELAGFPVPRQLDAILTVTALDHLHYGSDYAFTPEFVVDLAKQQLETGLAERDLAIADLAQNTRQLFPTLQDET